MARQSVETRLVKRSALPEAVDERPTEHITKCLLGVASLIMMGAGILADSPVAIGSGATLAGLLVLWRLVVDMRSGITSSNWGTWRRDEHRLAFRCNICFWGFITMLWSVLGVVTMFGFIRVPSP